ncbi:MAG TPA: MFS transporter [Chloroflexota bacterium]
MRAHRDFRLIFFGQLINNFGTQATQVALPYQLYLLTHSALALGALAGTQLAALLLFSLIGGAIADVIDRRRLLLCTQSGMCIVSCALAGLAIAGVTRPWHIYVLTFLGAILQAIDRPARTSMLPRLVSSENLGAAISLQQAGVQMSRVLGPPFGGLLISAVGLPAGYSLDALTFSASLAALLSIASLPPLVAGARPNPRAILEGFRYVRTMPVLSSAFAIDLNAMVFGLPSGLFPVLAVDVFHVGARGLGLLLAAPALGSVMGSLSAGTLRHVRYKGRFVVGAVLVWGLAITSFGAAPFFPLALLFLIVGGAADGLSATLRWTIIQMTTPDQLRGRVTSLNLIVVGGGPRLGDVESTTVASLTNARFSVISGGLACLAGVALVLRWFPALMSYDSLSRQPALEPLPPVGVQPAIT